MTCEDLEAIARTSRQRNIERDITGILLCRDGSALQILEGEKDAVLELYEIIAKDSRISNALVLIKRMSSQREFPDWSMGFKNASASEAAFELCARSFPEALPANLSPEVNTIGRTFARVNGLA